MFKFKDIYVDPPYIARQLLGDENAQAISNFAHLTCWDLISSKHHLNTILTKYGY